MTSTHLEKSPLQLRNPIWTNRTMSMAYAFLAVSGPTDLVIETILDLCPNLDVQESRRGLNSFDQVYKWCAPRSGYLEGTHPNDTKAFFQHKGWSVVVDFSMCMSSEDELLQHISETFGMTVTVTTQGTAGFASYSLHEDGRLLRRLTALESDVAEEGQQQPSESKIDVSKFQIKAADVLWKAHGLPSFLVEPLGPFTAIHYVDRLATPTTVSKLESGMKTPWWRRLSTS